VVGDRLLVLPGKRGAPVIFEPTAADDTTIKELALDRTVVQQVRGVLSGDLASFPALSSSAPAVNITIGGEGPHVAPLGAVPADLTEVRSLLEDAIHDAHTSPAFTAAQVVVVGDRLLVLPGTTDEITIGPSETDAITVEQLALSNKVALDVDLGRFTFAVGDEPKNSVAVSYSYGFSADIGGGPYDRRQTLADPDQALWEKTVDQQDPNADFQNLDDSLTAWANPADGNKTSATITIMDNGTYTQTSTIEPANRGHLVLQADDGKRPTLRFVDAQGDLANLVISGASGSGADLTLNGLLIEGGIYVERDSLGQLRIVNCTLVPGRELDEKGGPREPDRPSVVVESPNSRLGVEIDHSIVGALRLPAENVDLAVRDSIVDSPTRDRPARRIPALISDDLIPFPSLGSTSPRVKVSIGDEGPYTAILSGVPATLSAARDQLQAAIRNAHGGRAFAGTRVIIVDNQLAVLPGAPGVVTIDAAGGDPTATNLRLERTQARQVYALVTGVLPPSFSLRSPSPMVNVTIGDEGPHTADLSGTTRPGSPASARDRLQPAIRAAHASSAFKVLVGSTEDNRLVVLPGIGGAAVFFSSVPTDETTLEDLALEGDRSAIAESDGGDRPGPPATLERTTVLGAVHLKELIWASEIAFTAPIVIQRRQAGCVRFSHVPRYSQTPRRYRCQPDLALEGVSDPARRDSIRTRLTPSFTSVQYGHPAYAQLGLTCAEEISAGAESGSEMGAFSSLKQPQREANLRVRIDEYLPFGLEAGIIYAT
jgi:hypothetical protein